MHGAGAGSGQAQAPACAERARDDRLLAFVGGNGLGLTKLTRFDVEALLGAPEDLAATGKAPERGGGARSLSLRYPSLGLSFSVDAGQASEANPVLSNATVELPSDRCTPQGLCLGMRQEQAIPIIDAVYRVGGRISLTWGVGGHAKGEAMLASNRGWRVTQRARFDFREGRLHRMSFQLRPTPLVGFEQIRALFVALLAYVIATLLLNAMTAVKQRLGPWWERGRLALSGIMVAVGGAGIVLGLASFGDWNPYSRMAGALMALYAASLILVALRLLSTSSSASISRTAGMILLTIVVLAGSAKFL